jgi:hypothetical protein
MWGTPYKTVEQSSLGYADLAVFFELGIPGQRGAASESMRLRVVTYPAEGQRIDAGISEYEARDSPL